MRAGFPNQRAPVEPSTHLAEQPTACSCTNETLPTPNGEIVVLRVGGEVDLLTLPTLQSGLDTHLARRPRHLLVDLARVTFCSARGMAALVHAGKVAGSEGIDYGVSGAPPWLERAFARLWRAEELPARYREVATAVLMMRIRHDAPWP